MIAIIRRAVLPLMLLFSIVCGSTAFAQSPLLTSGAPLQFVIKGDTVQHWGRNDLATRDSLLIRGCADCKQTRFAMNDFVKLDVLVHSKRSPLAAAIGGGVVGLLGGAIVGLGVGALVDSQQHCSAGRECWHGLAEAAGVIVFAPVGAVIGLTTGAIRARDRWHHIIPAE